MLAALAWGKEVCLSDRLRERLSVHRVLRTVSFVDDRAGEIWRSRMGVGSTTA